MSRLHRLGGAVTTALAVALLPTTSSLAQPAASIPAWHEALIAHYGGASDYSGYMAVTAPAATDAWAFGGADLATASSPPDKPVAEHWNGHIWEAAALPAGVSSVVDMTSATSPSDMWAASALGESVLHSTGTTWTVAKSWASALPGDQITGLTAISPTNVWVFGAPDGMAGIGAWHYDGHTWAKVPAASGISEASAASATSIWALGGSGASGQIAPDSIWRSNGKTWWQATAASKLLTGDVSLFAIDAVSAANVWAGGFRYSAGTFTPVLLHWDGRAWNSVSVPGNIVPGTISSDGDGGLFFTGYQPEKTGAYYLLHRSASGTWTTQTAPSLTAMAHITGTTSMWAVGSAATKAGSNAVIEGYGTATS